MKRHKPFEPFRHLNRSEASHYLGSYEKSHHEWLSVVQVACIPDQKLMKYTDIQTRYSLIFVAL